jgi:serine/threonine protein kinase
MSRTVSHYRILERIGDGGMGVVYKAEDLKLSRYVALKFLAEDMAHDPRNVERFQREARAASALNHPNICIVYAVDDFEGQHFISMELLQGGTLKQRLLGANLNFESLLDMALQISDGLQAAHERGIIHRDIKPANIFVTEQGQIKIVDFGLAKRVNDGKGPSGADPTFAYGHEKEQHLTVTGATWGTVAYMSPEQAQGKALDARSDIFSFGSVLYEMATGALPFPADNAAVIIVGILQRKPLPATQVNPALPADLERIIDKAMEKDCDMRYQSMADLRRDLKRLKRDSESQKVAAQAQLSISQPIPVAIPVQPQAAPKPRRGLNRFLLAAFVVLAIAVGVLGVKLYERQTGGFVWDASPSQAATNNLAAPTASPSPNPAGAAIPIPGATPQPISSGSAVLPDAAASGIYINGSQLTSEQVQGLRATYGAVAPPGQYWYDTRSGLWGLWGHEAAGFIRPGHDFGMLAENASNGNTGVFINGREINLVEAQYIQQAFGAVYQGRWWLDGVTGNFGLEGNPTPIANMTSAFRGGQQSGGDTGYRWRDGRGSVAASEGNCFIMSVPGANTVSTPGCN